ncbi:hypothetical protein AOLI_G00072430 [Acnodon oligacanthus]
MKRFDEKVRESTLDIGDRVLVRNLRMRSKHKLADRWEAIVYVVIKKMGDLPVYSVKPETENGPVRTLHRDLLLPCGFLSAEDEQPPTKPSSNPRPRARQSPILQSEDENSESENYCRRFRDGNTVPAVEKKFTKVYHASYNKNQGLNLPDEPNLPTEGLTPESNLDEEPPTGKPVEEENQAQTVSEVVDEAVEEERVLRRSDGEVLSDDDVPLIDLSDLDGVSSAQAKEMPDGGSQLEGAYNNRSSSSACLCGGAEASLIQVSSSPSVSDV